jgi:hypothetical protein
MSISFSNDEKGVIQFFSCILFAILYFLFSLGLHLADVIPIQGGSIGFIGLSLSSWLIFHLLRNSKYKYATYFFEGWLMCIAMILVNGVSLLLSKTFFDSKQFQILFALGMMFLAGISDFVLNKIFKKTPANSTLNISQKISQTEVNS